MSEWALDRAARSDGVTAVLALFSTLNHRTCAKLIPATDISRFQNGGIAFSGFASGGLGRSKTEPDLVARPDATSYSLWGHTHPRIASVQCDVYAGDDLWPFAPRSILKRHVVEATRLGVIPSIGMELEYYLVAQGGAADTAPVLEGKNGGPYALPDSPSLLAHLATMTATMDALGWRPEASMIEAGDAQFELNFRHGDALMTADRVVTLRHLVASAARLQGWQATFMPKPFTDQPGNGLHLNISLRRGDSQVFERNSLEARRDLSEDGLAFVAGIINRAVPNHMVLAPTVNSYKRTYSRFDRTDGSEVPFCANWGYGDRSKYIRVTTRNVLEVRACDSAANPYLATAVTLAAGLEGMRRPRLQSAVTDLTELQSDGLPRTLLEAADALHSSDEACRALAIDDGSVGRYYAQAARQEFLKWHNVVSDWERERYLR